LLKKLKIDFHVHTGEDPKDTEIKYSAKQLLDKAAGYHFDAITIANHNSVLYTDELCEYAEQKGILLIPGIEVYVEGKHVLIVNCQRPYHGSLNFQNIREYAGEDALIIAPHPFYPREYCLGEMLEENIEVFDAIEYAHLHFRFINFNNKAVAIAKKYNLPIVGTSDTHTLRQLNTTYSLVESHKTIPTIINAVKNKRVEIVTHPLSTWRFFKSGSRFLFSSTKKFIQRTLSVKPRKP
jgi:predicted metal-dependent phosphoesterase TrpH